MSQKPTILKLLKRRNLIISRANVNFIPYGGSNPYSYCPSCEASIIQVNSSQGHYKGCSVFQYQQQLKSLNALIKEELSKFQSNNEINSKNFKDYLFEQQDYYIEGLSELEDILCGKKSLD